MNGFIRLHTLDSEPVFINTQHIQLMYPNMIPNGEQEGTAIIMADSECYVTEPVYEVMDRIWREGRE